MHKRQNCEFVALASVARHVCELPANVGLNFAASSCDVRATFVRHSCDIRATFAQHSCECRAIFLSQLVQFFCRNLVTKCLNYVAICSQFILNSFAILSRSQGCQGSSRPECQILIFFSNQSQFSCIGRQPLTKLSHISRTF